MTGPAMASRAATQPAPWAFAAPWGAHGYVTDLDGPVHWVEFGPGEDPGRDEPPVVFVHGLGGSHLNWCLIGPQLAANRRAVALDLHGFGLTPGPPWHVDRAAQCQAPRSVRPRDHRHAGDPGREFHGRA